MANLRLSCLFQKTWIPPLCGTHRSGWASSNRICFEPSHISLSHCIVFIKAFIFWHQFLNIQNQFGEIKYWAGSNHTCFEPDHISYVDKSLCFHKSLHFLPFLASNFNVQKCFGRHSSIEIKYQTGNVLVYLYYALIRSVASQVFENPAALLINYNQHQAIRKDLSHFT